MLDLVASYGDNLASVGVTIGESADQLISCSVDGQVMALSNGIDTFIVAVREWSCFVRHLC